MILDIRTIPSGKSSVSQKTDLDAYKDDLPAVCGKISCEAVIDRTGQILHVYLKFSANLSLECSRCMGVFTYPVSGSIRLTVKEEPGRYGASPHDETVDFYYDSRHLEVDLSSAIYEEIITSLPIKPLCAEECRGIELENAGGAEKGTDPRWEALKKLHKSRPV